MKQGTLSRRYSRTDTCHTHSSLCMQDQQPTGGHSFRGFFGAHSFLISRMVPTQVLI